MSAELTMPYTLGDAVNEKIETLFDDIEYRIECAFLAEQPSQAAVDRVFEQARREVGLRRRRK